MQTNIEKITKSIISLSKKERLEIARLILFLDNQSSDMNIDSEWEKEIAARMDAIDQGTAVGLDYKKATEEIKIRFDS